MSLEHVSLATGPAHFQEVRDFYVAILQPLGYKVYYESVPKISGLVGPSRVPDFWLHSGDEDFPKITAANADKRGGKTHVAFRASSRKQVDEWYRNAIKVGGIPNGEPGERPYVKGYYAAFILDPLGNNIEVVHWNPLWLQAVKSLPNVANLVIGGVLAQVSLVVARKYGLL